MEKATNAVQTFCEKYYPSFIRHKVNSFYDRDAMIMRSYPGETPMSGNLPFMKNCITLEKITEINILNAMCTDDDESDNKYIAYTLSKVTVESHQEYFMNHTVFFSLSGKINITKDVMCISDLETMKVATPVLTFSAQSNKKAKPGSSKAGNQNKEKTKSQTTEIKAEATKQTNKFQEYKPDAKHETKKQNKSEGSTPGVKPETQKRSKFEEYKPGVKQEAQKQNKSEGSTPDVKQETQKRSKFEDYKPGVKQEAQKQSKPEDIKPNAVDKKEPIIQKNDKSKDLYRPYKPSTNK